MPLEKTLKCSVGYLHKTKSNFVNPNTVNFIKIVQILFVNDVQHTAYTLTERIPNCK